MMVELLTVTLATGALPFDALDRDASVGVVVSLAVNLDGDDLDRMAAGLELALARSTTGLSIVRVRPDGIPTSCGSDPDCAARVRERLGVDEAWFLLLARVGDDVRFDGVRWSRGAAASTPLDPFIVPRDQLRDPSAYGAPPPAAPGAGPAPPDEALAADAAPDVRRPVPIATWILGGAAAAALGTGIGFGIAARATESDAEDAGCGVARACPEEADRIEQQALAADVFYGVAAASAVGAAVVFFIAPRPGGADRPRVGATPLTGGALVTVGGRF
jgi:hypothetical protein